jgi:hypothetical protein
MAPEVMRELGAHHSHAILSASREPGARLLQLFLFPDSASVPDPLRPTLDWAVENGLVAVSVSDGAMDLTAMGMELVREWDRIATITW